MLKLKLQYFGHLMWRTESLEKTLMLGKTEGGRRRGWQRMRLLDGITDLMDMSLSRLWELVMNRQALHAAVHGITKSWMWLSNWTELNWFQDGSKDTQDKHSILKMFIFLVFPCIYVFLFFFPLHWIIVTFRKFLFCYIPGNEPVAPLHHWYPEHLCLQNGK